MEDIDYQFEEEDSEDESDLDYTLYRDREEWKDVTPLPQEDGIEPVVRISYSEQFRDVFDYFRGILATGEKSERALELTKDAISMNAANYTVWQYRRDILQALGVRRVVSSTTFDHELQEEFNFTAKAISHNQKNYQVWQHQRVLVAWATGYDECTGKMDLTCPNARKSIRDQELKMTSRLLHLDAKNYHVWQHRQWVVQIFNEYEGELEFSAELILDDVRNNSAWSHRHFVITRNNSLSQIPEDVISREIKYAWDNIVKAISNESPWNYLRGVLDLTSQSDLSCRQSVFDLCSDIKNTKCSPLLLNFMLELLQDFMESPKGTKKMYHQSLKIADELIKLDPIREKYWQYCKRKIISEFEDKYCKQDTAG